jgi:diphthamide biosynthesis methyltransferase
MSVNTALEQLLEIEEKRQEGGECTLRMHDDREC